MDDPPVRRDLRAQQACYGHHGNERDEPGAVFHGIVKWYRLTKRPAWAGSITRCFGKLVEENFPRRRWRLGRDPGFCAASSISGWLRSCPCSRRGEARRPKFSDA